jgi:hypothetical protein
MRVVNYSGSDPDFHSNNKVLSQEERSKVIDTFSLNLNYPDPFLKSSFSSSKANTSEKNKKTNGTKSKPLPNIKYYGMVMNQEERSVQINLQLNSKFHIMAMGETIQDVKLVNVFGDSIQIQYKGKSYTIHK